MLFARFSDQATLRDVVTAFNADMARHYHPGAVPLVRANKGQMVEHYSIMVNNRHLAKEAIYEMGKKRPIKTTKHTSCVVCGGR